MWYNKVPFTQKNFVTFRPYSIVFRGKKRQKSKGIDLRVERSVRNQNKPGKVLEWPEGW